MTKKISSPKELMELGKKLKAETQIRSEPKEIQVTIHMGTCGIAAGARDVMENLAAELLAASVGNVTLKRSGCIGLCHKEPMLTLTDASGGKFIYGPLDAIKVKCIVRDHIIGGTPVKDLLAAG